MPPTSPIHSEAGLERRHGSRGLPVAAFSVSACCFFGLLFERVWSYGVDVVFWDQWDILRPFYAGDGLWSAFRQQFGPQRHGVGALVIAASNALSGWDMRILSAVTVGMLVVGMLVAVRLKIVLYGELTLCDALIPPLFFRLSQQQAIASIANPAHGAVPIILVLCCCLALAVESRARQAAILIPVAFLTVHTGFSNLFLPVLAGILLLRGAAEAVNGRRREAAFTALTIVGIVLTALTFLIGFTRNGIALECEEKAKGGIHDYLVWIVTQFSHYWGLAEFPVSLTLATLLILGLLSALVVSTFRSAGRGADDAAMRRWARHSVPLALVSYSLVFSIASAWGRLCGGGGYALSSRYVTHMIPLGLGVFFAWLIALRNTRGKRIPSVVVRTAGVVLAVISLWGACYGRSADHHELEAERNGKIRWAECVRAGGSAAECVARARFAPYPYLELLDEPIGYLRERKLSFFSPDWSNPEAGSSSP